MKGWLWICFWALSLGADVLSAQISHVHFTTSDGLPSDYVYGALEDKEGQMWIYTDAGVAKFDGAEFTIFDRSSGLPSDDIFYLHEDDEGRLWAFNVENQPCYIQEDSVVVFEGDYRVFYEHAQRIYAYKHGVLELFDPSSSRFIPQESNNVLVEIGPEDFLDLMKRVFSVTDVANADDHLDNIASILSKKMAGNNGRMSGLISPEASYVYFSGGDELFVYNVDSKKSMQFDFEGTSIHHSDKAVSLEGANLRVSTSSYSALFSPELDLIEQVNYGLGFGHVVSLRSAKDSEGNLWVGSRNDGLYLFPSEALAAHHIAPLKGSAGMRYIVPQQNSFLSITDEADVISHTDNLDISYNPGRVNGITTMSGGTVFQYTSGKTQVVQNGKDVEGVHDLFERVELDVSVYRIKFNDLANVKLLRLNQDNSIMWFTYLNQCYKVVDDGSSSLIAVPVKYSVLDYICEEDFCIILTDDGLLLEKNGIVFNTVDFKSVERIYFLSSNEVVLSTYDHQVLRLDLQSHVVDTLMSDIRVRDIEVASANEIYVADRQAIHYLRASAGRFELAYTYDWKDGLAAQNINDIALAESSLFSAGTNGIFEIPIRKQLSKPLTVIGGDFYWQNHTREGNYQTGDAINASYNLRHYPSYGHIMYEYKLSPEDMVWKQTTERDLRFSGLSAGNYTLQVKATDRFGNQYELEPWSFRVKSPWWRTWYSGIAAVLLCFLIGAYAYRSFISRRHQKEVLAHQLREEVTRLQLQGVKSHLKPDFVFNTLSALQYHIGKGDHDLAEEQLNQLGDIIRYTVKRSDSPWSTIDEELSLMKKYISLQNFRYDSNMRLDVIMLRSVTGREVFPSMILMSFLECITQDLVSLDASKELSLNLEIQREKSHFLVMILVEGSAQAVQGIQLTESSMPGLLQWRDSDLVTLSWSSERFVQQITINIEVEIHEEVSMLAS